MFNTFGNKVRIRSSPETVAKGLVGKIGKVYGETTPSMMEFEVVGTPNKDYAINVYFEELKESIWFAEELLEKLDDGVGTVISLDGIDLKWTKGDNGEWIKSDNKMNQEASVNEENTANYKKKWWRIWKK
jgi:hypothetical protein